MSSLEIPQYYGYVLLSCVVGPFVSSMMMGGQVMKARDAFNVPYPNAYATPGVHKEADAFNRVQRGHQNALEAFWFFVPAALIGGLKHPIAVAVEGVCFSLGCYLYQAGYADTSLDAKKARHLKGGPIKYVGLFGALGALVSVAGSLNGWWK
jgi:glutathione S-transferase